MASTPQNIFNKSFIREQGESKIQRVMPTDKSWADTDYKLAYENTKSVLQMQQILNFSS
jgi:zinc protease